MNRFRLIAAASLSLYALGSTSFITPASAHDAKDGKEHCEHCHDGKDKKACKECKAKGKKCHCDDDKVKVEKGDAAHEESKDAGAAMEAKETKK